MKNIEFLNNIQAEKKLYRQYIILSPISRVARQKYHDNLSRIIRKIRLNKIYYERYRCYIYFLKNCFEVDVTSNSNIYREVQSSDEYNYIDDENTNMSNTINNNNINNNNINKEEGIFHSKNDVIIENYCNDNHNNDNNSINNNDNDNNNNNNNNSNNTIYQNNSCNNSNNDYNNDINDQNNSSNHNNKNSNNNSMNNINNNNIINNVDINENRSEDFNKTGISESNKEENDIKISETVNSNLSSISMSSTSSETIKKINNNKNKLDVINVAQENSNNHKSERNCSQRSSLSTCIVTKSKNDINIENNEEFKNLSNELDSNPQIS